MGMHGYDYTYSWRFSWITQRYETLYKQSSVNMLAVLQSSFRIVCDLFEKVPGMGVVICPMVFHDVVEEHVCIFNHRVCAPCHQTVELLRPEKWQEHDVCPLPHSLIKMMSQSFNPLLCMATLMTYLREGWCSRCSWNPSSAVPLLDLVLIWLGRWAWWC